MPYNLFKSSNTVTPFVIVQDNTIDSSATSVFLIGRRKEAYGQGEQQSKLWILENFANSTAPVNAINGQCWYNTVDNKLYVCVDENTQTFRKVSNPIVSSSAPSLSLSVGDLWYDDANQRLNIWDGTAWDVVGPQSPVPLSVEERVYLNVETTNSSPTVMWVNGSIGQRMTIPNNTSWNFEITVSARRTDAGSEFIAYVFRGGINNTGNTVTMPNGVLTEILQVLAGAGFTVAVAANNTDKSLDVQVVGEPGKNIRWQGVAKLVKVSN